MAAEENILFFDGVCALCNGAVQFIIRHDRTGRIKFASLQSAAGQEAIKKVQQLYGTLPDSLIFFQKGRYHMYADAALKAAALLDGGWKALRIGFIFPKFIRDAIYRFIAKNRYRWFGKQDVCMIPTPELQSRFLS